MTRGSSPYSRTAAAAGAGAVTGGIATTVTFDHELTELDNNPILPVAVATAVALAAIRRWLGQHEERTKADVRALADQHIRRADELDRRERLLLQREHATERREATYGLRMRSIAQNLDDARSEVAAKTRAMADLQRNYDEVRNDHNALIEHMLREGSDRFTSRGEGSSPALVEEVPRRSEEHRRTPASVTLIQPRGHQDSG